MNQFEIEVLFIAVVVAVSCALVGTYLVLRKLSLMSDAISHAILLGIVLAFFVTHDLASPLLIAGAAVTGLFTVAAVELLHRTDLVRQDAAIALVFPSLFSLGVILIAGYAGNVHLDVDAVLLGELAFAPFDRLTMAGVDVGPKALWVMGPILLLNIGAIMLFYKELELATFDAALAAVLGFSPVVLHYGLMALVSLTAVGSFDAVGSILVVALMIVPPASAYLMTDRLPHMLLLSAFLAVIATLAGYGLARGLDASLAGSMVTCTGLIFLLVYFLAPERGLLTLVRRHRRRRLRFAEAMLAIHILHHEGTDRESEECRILHLDEHLGWSLDQAEKFVYYAETHGTVQVDHGRMYLTDKGRHVARKALEDLP